MHTRDTIDIEIHSVHAAIVTLNGEHDLGTKAEVMLALRAASVCPHVIVDLSGCTFADSSVIGSIMQASRRAEEADGSLGLVSPAGGRAIRRTLSLMGIDSLVHVHGSREAAIDSAHGVRSQIRLRAVSARIDETQLRRA